MSWIWTENKAFLKSEFSAANSKHVGHQLISLGILAGHLHEVACTVGSSLA